MVLKNSEDFKVQFKKVISEMENGYIIAMLTDEFDIQDIASEEFIKNDTYSEKLYKRGLEIRIFNKNREAKWFRTSMNESFFYRDRIDDKNMEEKFICREKEYVCSYWDERQYLDIDETKSNPAMQRAVSTGGGEYRLPLPKEYYKDAQVIIRNYLEYDKDTMQAFVCDWRLVDFVREGDR